MSRVFVFGIGGTGARVIKSLTFLLAAGVKCEREIVPVIIDIDKDNGDLTRTLQLLKWYNKIQLGISSVNSAESLKQDKNFFCNPISSWDSLGENQANEGSFHWNVLESTNPDHDNLDDFIESISLAKEDREFVEALFSDKDRSMDLDVGFKGRPNIGSIILNAAFEDQDSYINLVNTFKAGDRAFFIGSLFGGTGAAGLPLLVKNFRDPKIGKKEINDALIGGLLVLPYFDLAGNAGSEIDSKQFRLKTKAALTYYSRTMYNKETGFDHVYYLGDTPPSSEGYTNEEGASVQKNKASIIEVAGALSILDFANGDDKRGQKTQYKEFGLKDSGNESANNLKRLNFQHLAEKTQSIINGAMIRFYLASYFDKRLMSDAIQKKKPAWVRATKNLGLGQSAFIDANDFYDAWKRFLGSYYGFLEELKNNGARQFAPFELSENASNQTLNKFVVGVKSGPNFKFPLALRSLNDEYLTYCMNYTLKQIQPTKNNMQPQEAFVALINAMAQKTYKDFFNELYKKEEQA